MKKTHQIGLMTALFAGVALTTFSQDPVQSTSIPVSSNAAVRLTVNAGYDDAFVKTNSGDFYWQQMQSFWTGGSDLNTLGVRLAYSFGL